MKITAIEMNQAKPGSKPKASPVAPNPARRKGPAYITPEEHRERYAVLETALEACGGLQTEVALRLGIDRAGVSKWAREYEPVPAKHMAQLRRIAKGEEA